MSLREKLKNSVLELDKLKTEKIPLLDHIVIKSIIIKWRKTCDKFCFVLETIGGFKNKVYIRRQGRR